MSETKSLPEDAYTPLAPGRCTADCAAGATVPELTWRSVGWGVLLCIIFSGPRRTGLEGGQVMEAAIPISILAIGLARGVPARRSSLLENVIITSIGGRGGVGGGGRHLHIARALHSEAGSASRADDLHLRGGRVPGDSVPHPAAPLFRAGHARQIPLPGGDGHHGSAWSPAKRAARRPGCCSKLRRYRASTISSRPRSRFGRSESICNSCRPCARSQSGAGWCSASTPSRSSWGWDT